MEDTNRVKDDVREIVMDMQEKIGELADLNEELKRLGYDDYRVSQELDYGYMGDNLRTLVDGLGEEIEREMEEDEWIQREAEINGAEIWNNER